MKSRTVASIVFGASCLALGLDSASAASIKAEVRDTKGNQLQNAVVYATPVAGLSGIEPVLERQVIEQIDKEFVPAVSVFAAGSEVAFPNNDSLRHHVYSFSEAKTFEIPLYKGEAKELIEFDKPGAVSLGCNIHDWMSAHIYVVETPYFGLSDGEGRLELLHVPPGEYDVAVWHPQQKGEPEASAQRVAVSDESDNALAFVVESERSWRAFRAPVDAAGSYR